MRSVLLVALLFCVASSGLTQTKSLPSAAAPSYDGEALVVQQSETAIRYNADGTGEKNLHLLVKIQNQAGARLFSVLSFAYTSANESVHLQSLRALHIDGTFTDTPATDAIDMPAPVTQQAPLYSDLKLQQVPVRGLRTGDTLEYRVHIQRKSAESPTQFWDAFTFPKDVVVLTQSLTLDLPVSKYVQVWSPKLRPTVTESAGRRIYQWSDKQLKPTHPEQKKSEDTPEPPADNKPLVAWTTFHTWQEVGEWYRSLAAPRALATDALRAQADEITREAKTPEEQVRALYTFVATRIRYVGIDLGIGRYQPHLAAEVLANQYGDCKDKDTLLEALLRAKGFTAAPALIGVNIDMVPEVPSPGFLNHVITTVNLPSGKLWMDTTAEIAPFQLLLAPLRDKDALVIPSVGVAAIERTPANLPYPFVDHFVATATISADGKLTGHVEAHYRSDSEIVVRTIGRSIAPGQWDQGTQYLANLLGFSGKTSNSVFANADDTSVPMHVSYDYTRKPFGDWDTLRIVPLLPINFLPETPEKQPSAEIDLGAVRTESSISRIRLPEKFDADLPDGIRVKTPFATYEKTYKLEGGEVIAEKTLVILQSKLPAASWQQYKKFAKDISLGEEAWVQLTTNSAAGNRGHSSKVTVKNPLAAQLIADAITMERSGNLEGALKKLDEAKKIHPEQPFLWSNYGYVAMVQNKSEEAKKHFSNELALYPDESYVAWLYAGYLRRLGESQEARKLLRTFFNNDPSDPPVALLLASIEAEASLPDAISTLRRASEAAPKNRAFQDALGGYLISNQQSVEAISLARTMLEGADTPETLNGAAYLLAQTRTDLPLAEQSARKALEMLDAGTASASVSEANARSFERTSMLIATWDTLGFVLFEENKLDEARDYLEAAWRNNYDQVVGSHYAQLQEALGDSKAALRTYELARGDKPMASTRDIQPIDANIMRLKKAGVASTVNAGAIQLLQEERSFKVKLNVPRRSYCSATFRLQVSSNSAQAVMLVSGEPSLEVATQSIKQLHLPHLVPTHSTARILRDAVLSCSAGAGSCEFVLMPIGNINAERSGD